MADVDIEGVGSAEGAQVRGSQAETDLPGLDPLAGTAKSFPPSAPPPRAREPTPWEPPVKTPTSAGGAFVKPPGLPTGTKGFIYWNPKKTGYFISPRILNEDEVRKLFTQPLSVDHEAMQKALDLNARVGEAARQARETFSTTKKTLSAPSGRAGASAAVFGVVPSLVKTGVTLAGAAKGHPFMGAAAGDVAKQGIERVIGSRGGFSPAELAAETLTGGFAPGPQAGMKAALTKGAAFGAGSTTLDSIIMQGKIPKPGQIAMGAIVGSLVTGGFHSVLGSSLHEISTADVAHETSVILGGDQKALTELLKDKSPADIADIKEIVETLPRIRKGFTKDWSIPQPAMYRGAKGFFRGFSQLRALNPHLMTTEGPAEQGEFVVPRGTEGDLPRPKGDAQRAGYFRNLFKPAKAYFGRAQQRTGLPVYSEMYSPIYDQNTRAIEFNNSRMSEAKNAFQGLKYRTLDKFQAWLEMPDKNQAAQILQFGRGDESRAHELNRTWDRAFNAYGLEDGLAPAGMTRSEEYLTQHLPKMRQARYDLMSRGNPEPSNAEIINQAFPTGVPKSVQFFRDAIENENVDITDTNPAAMLGKHLKAGSYTTWVEQYAKDAQRRFVNNPDVDHGLKVSTTHFLNQVKGGHDVLMTEMANWVHWMSKTVGHPIAPKTTKNIVNTFIMAQYGSTLGFRPGPLLRNYLQTWQTGFSELGGKYYIKGLLAANSNHGRVLATQLGLHAGDPGLVAEVMSNSGGLPRDVGSLTRFAFGRFTEKSLARYSGTDELNRNIMGLGQYARALDAMARAGGNAERFIKYARLNTGLFQPGEREELMRIARTGNFSEAARRSAVGLADNTQWSYRPEARVPLTTGVAGRAFGAFGNWGQNYADYMKRLTLPENWKLDPGFQAQRLGRYMMANAAIYMASVGLGSAAGVQNAWTRPLGWLFINPAIWSGPAPIPQEIFSGIMSENELSAAQPGGQYQKRFLEGASNFIPGAGVVRDFSHVIQPRKGKTQGEEVLQSLGLQPGMQP